MQYAIHKIPVKVSLTGMVGLGMYFAVAVMFFRGNDYYYLVLGGGLWMAAILFMKSIASSFISTYTVTESSIETVTLTGGIIRIYFADLDWEKTNLSEIGITLVPKTGESIVLLVTEFSRQDIARLARHVGLVDTEWFQDL